MARDKNDLAGTVSGADQNKLSQDPSATSTGANSEATGTEGAKKRATSAPRAPQKRVLHIFYKATTGADGQPGIEIVNVLGDARKVVEFMDSAEYANGGLRRYKYEMVSTPRGSGEGGEGDAA